MTEEPYRWLEAIQNRREYVRDQLKGATPVFALSRPEGVLLLGVGQGHSKVFEIYDRHAFAALGHPVDIEKVRQAAIESAHLEGFNRSSRDVTLRRLISFALSTTLKSSFEQIFSPIMVEAIFAEVGSTPANDVLARLHYDGNHHYETSGVLVAFTHSKREEEAAAWLRNALRPDLSLLQAASLCLAAWHALMGEKPFATLHATPSETLDPIPGKTLEAALLDRRVPDPLHYQSLNLADVKS